MAELQDVISHWHQSVEALSTSTLEYYAAVEKALRDKEVPDLRIERTTFSEHGILSAKREYLRVRYGRLQFDICGAPFGRDYFFSWWLVHRTSGFAALGCAILLGLPALVIGLVGALGLLKGIFAAIVVVGVGATILRNSFADGWSTVEDSILAIPIAGYLYRKYMRPVTYYSEDTRMMFEETVHRVVLQVCSGILTLNNLPELSAEQLKSQSRNALL